MAAGGGLGRARRGARCRSADAGSDLASDRTGTRQVFSLRDATLARLTFAAQASTRPVPSPDGRWIVFARAGASWRMRLDGTAQRRLLGAASDASWLPD